MGSTPIPDAEQNSMSWMSKSNSVMDFIGRFVSIKQHQQQQALSELQGVINLSGAGFPIDVKAFSRLVKKSKLPISTNEDDLKAFYDTEIARKQNPQGQKGEGQKGGGQGAPQSMTMPDGAPDYVRGAVDAHNKVASSGKPMDGGEMMGVYLNTLAGRARQMMNMKATTDAQKAQNESTVQSLRAGALAGSESDKGRLMGLGEIPVNVDYEKYHSMTDEQKKGMFDVLAGHESDADHLKRVGNIAESLVTSGRVTDPTAAYQISKIVASGGTVPPNMQSKIKPFTFSELGDQAILAGRLVELGVPPEKIGSVSKAAALGGLQNALPTGLKPIALEGMKLDQSRLEIEKLRYAKEVEIAARAGAAELRKSMTDEQKANLEQFKSLVELKKLGGSVPDDLLKGAQIKAGNALNMDVKEVDTLFHFLTGGTKLEFSPRLTDQGQDTVDELSGKSGEGKTKKPAQSDLQKIINVITNKRQKKEPL